MIEWKLETDLVASLPHLFTPDVSNIRRCLTSANFIVSINLQEKRQLTGENHTESLDNDAAHLSPMENHSTDDTNGDQSGTEATPTPTGSESANVTVVPEPDVCEQAGMGDASPQAQAIFKRSYVLKELVETEKDYVKDLTSLVEVRGHFPLKI